VSRRTFTILFLAFFSWVFGFGLYDDLFPIHARALGATPVQLGLLFTLRQLTIVAGSMLGGILSDRYSRRAVMLVSWFLGVPAPLLYWAAPSWPWLLPGVFLYEITIFGLPALNAYIAERTVPERIASTFATLTASSSLALLLAPALGGLVAARWGIPTTFLLALACYTLSTILIFRTERDQRARQPLPWRRALRFWESGGLWPLIAMLGLMTGVPVALAPFVSPFLREVRGLGLAQIGALGSVLSGGGLIFTLLAGRAADRWGHRRVLVVTMLLIAAGTLIVALGPVVLLPFAFLIRSRSAAQSLSQAVVGGRATMESAGRAFGLYGMLTGLVGAGGTFLAGFAYRVDPALPLIAGAALVTVLALILLLQRRAAAVSPVAVE
jgi:MFS family permease